MYQDKQRIARGAFAQVFTCQAPSFCLDVPELAVKVTDLPTAGDTSLSQVHATLLQTLPSPATPCSTRKTLLSRHRHDGQSIML